MTAPPDEIEETYLLRCAGCRYALRRLDPDSKCPECGLEISSSVEAAARARQPGWRRLVRQLNEWFHRPLPALARNSRAWLRTTALAPTTLALLVPVLVVWAYWREPVPWPARVPEWPLVWMTVGFAGAVWLLTRPDRPRQPVDALWTPIRWALRLLSLSPAAAATLAAYSETVPAADHPRYAAQAATLFPLTPLVAFLLLDYVAYLAARAWSVWTAWFFRAGMLLVTPVLVAWLTYEVRHCGFIEELYPDRVGKLAAFAVSGCGFAGVYTGLLCAALVRLAAVLWRLPNDPVAVKLRQAG